MDGIVSGCSSSRSDRVLGEVAVKEERDCLGGRSGRERGARLFGRQKWP